MSRVQIASGDGSLQVGDRVRLGGDPSAYVVAAVDPGTHTLRLGLAWWWQLLLDLLSVFE